jgi:hypothetical protein
MARTAAKTANYYVLDSESDDMMLLYEPEDPSDEEDWVSGHRFKTQPKEPVVVEIQEENEHAELLPFFGTATLMSDAFYEALREAGVDNLDVYDARIQSGDGSVVYEGYKAFNVIGMVQAADLSRTVFNDPSGSRLIDAGIENLAIDPKKTKDLLMFRLAEYVAAVIVHEKVKRAIEAKKFPYIVFREPSDFISL